MLHDGGQRDGEGPRQFTHAGTRLLVEPGEEGTACRIGQSGESAVERGGLIVNHNV